MFCVTVPTSRPAERRYIINTILGDFLGLPCRIVESERARDIRIELAEGDSKRSITIADGLLALPESTWLSPGSLPAMPLTSYVPPKEFGFEPNYSVPVIFGGGTAPAANAGAEVDIKFDLFGSAFFLLTRYEECAIDARDRFGRFPAAKSVMMQAGILDRPLVDEYTCILKRAIEARWPGTKCKERVFKIVPTHDVDCPYEYLFMSPGRIVKRFAKRLLAKADGAGARSAVAAWRRVRGGDDAADPFYTAIPRLMDLSEGAGLQSRFYFLAGNTNPQFDMDYDIAHPRIRALLKLIHARGHLIGLHPSYGTLGQPQLIKREFEILQRVCAEEKISQSSWSVRSHFLRWEPKRTFRDYDAAGFDFDSTLSFAEHAGFRCGTCHEFPVFDLASRAPLRLREQPLIAMECSVLESNYQGLNHDEAASFFKRLKEQCRSVNGQFIFLWHNNRFSSQKDWELYQQQIQNG